MLTTVVILNAPLSLSLCHPRSPSIRSVFLSFCMAKCLSFSILMRYFLPFTFHLRRVYFFNTRVSTTTCSVLFFFFSLLLFFCCNTLLKTTFYRWLLLYCHLPMLKHECVFVCVCVCICGNSSILHFAFCILNVVLNTNAKFNEHGTFGVFFFAQLVYPSFTIQIVMAVGVFFLFLFFCRSKCKNPLACVRLYSQI